jgi:ABC-type Fe3+-hydroxamate transport system substrate-binding protein
MNSAFLYDGRGVAHTPLSSTPLRLVSLVPSTTETLFALGRGDDLVGYTRFCVHPQDKVTSEKWIGGTKNPKVDTIIALAPNIVLANREENRREDIEALETAGIPVWVAEPRTVAEAIEDIRKVGILVGRSDEGHRFADELQTIMSTHPMKRDTQTVAYMIWQNPYMVAGQETFITDMLAQGGLVNPFAGRYPEVTIEDLQSVDHIFLASEPFPFAEKHRDELIKLGIPATKLQLVDGELLSWHGVRLREGLPYVQSLKERRVERRERRTLNTSLSTLRSQKESR